MHSATPVQSVSTRGNTMPPPTSGVSVSTFFRTFFCQLPFLVVGLSVLLYVLFAGLLSRSRRVPVFSTAQTSRTHAPFHSLPSSENLLLYDGPGSFVRLFELIAAAKKTIEVKMYIWRDDTIGNRLASSLLSAADRGVTITIIKDKLGAFHEKVEEYKQSFFHKHFQLIWYLLDKLYPLTWMHTICDPLSSSFPQQPNSLLTQMETHPNITLFTNETLYDHSKYYIIDSEILFLGGVNVMDSEVTRDVAGRIWADFMVEICSFEIVGRFRERIRGEVHRNSFKESSLEFVFNVRNLVMSNEEEGNDYFYDLFEVRDSALELFELAKRELIILVAYWSDPIIVSSILNMDPKINITIIVPFEANNAQNANRQVLKEAFIAAKKNRSNFKIIGTRRMLHGKAVLVDKRFLWLGTANFNMPSTEKTQESVIVLDFDKKEEREEHGALTRMKEMIEEIVKDGVEMKEEKDFEYCRFCAFVEKLFG